MGILGPEQRIGTRILPLRPPSQDQGRAMNLEKKQEEIFLSIPCFYCLCHRLIKIHHHSTLKDMIHEQPLCQEVKRNRSRVTDGEIFMETQRNTTRPGHLTTSLEVRETFINWNILFDGIQYYSNICILYCMYSR